MFSKVQPTKLTLRKQRPFYIFKSFGDNSWFVPPSEVSLLRLSCKPCKIKSIITLQLLNVNACLDCKALGILDPWKPIRLSHELFFWGICVLGA